MRALGLDAEIVSTGGTPNLANVGKLKGATEHRAGTYIFNDRMQVGCGAATLDDCALRSSRRWSAGRALSAGSSIPARRR